MDRFELKHFFLDLLELSYNDLRPGWGNPCSELLKTLMLRQDPFLDHIMGDYSTHSHEIRLNGAGLKMGWRVERDGDRSQFICVIAGDQAKEYPMFVVQARDLIMKYGFKKAIKWHNVR